MAPDFEISLSAARLLLPILSSGFLLCGLVLFSYLYYRSRAAVFRDILPLSFFAFAFAAGEGLLLLTGGWVHDARLGLEFHRLSQIAGAFFIFAIPLFLSTLVDAGPRERRSMRVFIGVCLLLSIIIAIVAYIAPDLFISMTVHKKSWLTNEGDYGRGKEGILYLARDIALALVGLYTLIRIVIEMIRRRNAHSLFLTLAGIITAFYCVADDIINIHFGFHIGLFPHTDYSRATLGITLFAALSMGGLIRDFIDRARQTEEARERATAEIAERERVEAEREKIREQLYQLQKMEAVGLLAGGIAHDFNNLLTAVIGSASLMKSEIDDMGNPGKTGQLFTLADNILYTAEKAAALTRQLLIFSRHRQPDPRPVDLNGSMKGMESILKRIIGERIDIRVDASPGTVAVMSDRANLEQVILNLVTNARDAMPEGGTINIRTGKRFIIGEAQRPGLPPDRSGEYGFLSVADTGPGIPEELREKIFEPFYTTKEEGRGTGLGLAVVYGIVCQHHGGISVDSHPGGGALFTIFLPMAGVDAVGEVAVVPAAGTARGSETVLLVEDDPDVRKVVEGVLQKAGYRVISAENGADGLERFMEHKGEVRLLITDVILPGLNGRDLYAAVRKEQPGIVTIFMSGYSSDIMDDEVMEDTATHYLTKPFRPDDLLGKIREALGSPGRPPRA
jgi:signal transduction histidine kinase/ActR/RegA family two-component response regulator